VAEAAGNNQGQQSESDSLAEANAEAQLAAEDRAADTEEAAHWNPDAERLVHEAWDRAEAADLRAQNAPRGTSQKGRSTSRGRGRGYSRQQSVSNLVRPTYHAPLHPTDVPYAKGASEKFWGKVAYAFFRFLGVA
jgi:hypothetical protein